MNWENLSDLYFSAGMGRKQPDDLRMAFFNSFKVCFLYIEGALIAVGRVVADGCYCALICDVAVHPSLQGKGIGTEIMNHFKEGMSDHKRVILFARSGMEDFYKKLGFSEANNFMVIYNQK